MMSSSVIRTASIYKVLFISIMIQMYFFISWCDSVQGAYNCMHYTDSSEVPSFPSIQIVSSQKFCIVVFALKPQLKMRWLHNRNVLTFFLNVKHFLDVL